MELKEVILVMSTLMWTKLIMSYTNFTYLLNVVIIEFLCNCSTYVVDILWTIKALLVP